MHTFGLRRINTRVRAYHTHTRRGCPCGRNLLSARWSGPRLVAASRDYNTPSLPLTPCRRGFYESKLVFRIRIALKSQCFGNYDVRMMKYRCFAREGMTGSLQRRGTIIVCGTMTRGYRGYRVRNGFFFFLLNTDGGWIFSKCFRTTLWKTDYGFNC